MFMSHRSWVLVAGLVGILTSTIPTRAFELPIVWSYQTADERGWYEQFPTTFELQVAVTYQDDRATESGTNLFFGEQRFVLATTGEIPIDTPLDITTDFDQSAAAALRAYEPQQPETESVGFFVDWSDGNRRVSSGRGVPVGSPSDFLTEAAITAVRFELESFRFGPPENPIFDDFDPPTPDSVFQFIGPGRVTFLPEPALLAGLPLTLLLAGRPAPWRGRT